MTKRYSIIDNNRNRLDKLQNRYCSLVKTMLGDKIANNIYKPIVKVGKLNTSFDIKTAIIIKLAMRYLTADLL